jgi:SAM-dependent methyltransferase
VRDGDLVCIRCHGVLAYKESNLLCRSCAATFPLVDGVPVVLPEELTEQQLAQSRYFDTEFAAYERYRPEAWRRSYVSRIFAALGIAEGRGPYLDVGVGGSGATVIEAARRGVPASGCDLSIEAVRRAAAFARGEGVGERTRFVVCAAELLPFPDRAFSCASAVAVLEHLDDDGAAVSELGRVLEPGGLLWITVPLAFRYVPPPLWPIYRRHDRKLGHKRHYDAKSLGRLLRAVGFERVATMYTGHPVKLVQLIASRLLSEWSPSGSRLWWLLERADLRAARRPWGALQLSAVFVRS